MSNAKKANAKEIPIISAKVPATPEGDIILSATTATSVGIPSIEIIPVTTVDTSTTTILSSPVSTVPTPKTLPYLKRRDNPSNDSSSFFASKLEEEEAKSMSTPSKKAKSPSSKKSSSSSSTSLSSSSSSSSCSSAVNNDLKEIKLEPQSKLAEINRKCSSGAAAAAAASGIAKFSDFTKSLQSIKQVKTSQFVTSSGPAKVLKNSSFAQQYTKVEYKKYTMLGEDNVSFVACITIGNIYGMKDIIFGSKNMDDGDRFFWPARMFYPHKVNEYMANAGITLMSSSSFLRDAQNKPIIILSFMSKCDTDDSFEDADNFLRNMIHGAVDPGSNATPKKLYSLVVSTQPLTADQVPALVAISAAISPVKDEYATKTDEFDILDIPRYINAKVDSNVNDDGEGDDDGDNGSNDVEDGNQDNSK